MTLLTFTFSVSQTSLFSLYTLKAKKKKKQWRVKWVLPVTRGQVE